MIFKCFKYLESQKQKAVCKVQFVDENNQPISNLYNFEVSVGEEKKVLFSLVSKASDMKKCYLLIKGENDSEDEAQSKVEFNINIAFSADFNF